MKISGWKAYINTRKLNWYVSTITGVFSDQKRLNVCEQAVKMAPRDSFGQEPPGCFPYRDGWRAEAFSEAS